MVTYLMSIKKRTFNEKIPKVTDHGVIAGAEDRKLFVGGLSWETKEVQLKD